MKTERNVKKRVRQDAHVFFRFKPPRPYHREVTSGNYTFPEINALCAEGWEVLSCQLQRVVTVDAVEVTLTGDDAAEAAAAAAAAAPASGEAVETQ